MIPPSSRHGRADRLVEGLCFISADKSYYWHWIALYFRPAKDPERKRQWTGQKSGGTLKSRKVGQFEIQKPGHPRTSSWAEIIPWGELISHNEMLRILEINLRSTTTWQFTSSPYPLAWQWIMAVPIPFYLHPSPLEHSSDKWLATLNSTYIKDEKSKPQFLCCCGEVSWK